MIETEETRRMEAPEHALATIAEIRKWAPKIVPAIKCVHIEHEGTVGRVTLGVYGPSLRWSDARAVRDLMVRHGAVGIEWRIVRPMFRRRLVIWALAIALAVSLGALVAILNTVRYWAVLR